MCRFHVGQQVVSLKDRPYAGLVKDYTYTILGIKKGICNCYPWLVDVGRKTPKRSMIVCDKCSLREPQPDDTYWLTQDLFAPIDLSEVSLEELICEPMSA